ncbi:OmpA family protein [Paracoccus aurantiacus]|uniref:OmpA family protein n=1 Tax=Paracoccus aurantiacus TaxID=2599412 RepID=A0A5C6S588_9RHOB|nr:OmpA family protein [Paracoccus aurantiacus]TXB69666.1 OmpA family protein [Paracoccus aurantiacus]
MRLPLTLIAATLALSACNMPNDAAVVSAPVTDPYVNAAGGGAVYRGDVNAPGTRLPGVDSIAPGTDFAAAGTTVYFDESQAVLNDEGRATLTRQAQWLTQNAAYSAVVEGHADEPGTREFNLALGARRATSVQEYLVSKGVEAGRIRTVSFGKERPASICASEASCLARNRRAVTVVSQSQAGV